MIDQIKEYKEIPILGGLLAFISDLVLAGGDLIIGTISTFILSVGDVVPVLSLIAGTIAPRVEWIPQGLADQLLLGAAVLLVGIQLARLVQ